MSIRENHAYLDVDQAFRRIAVSADSSIGITIQKSGRGAVFSMSTFKIVATFKLDWESRGARFSEDGKFLYTIDRNTGASSFDLSHLVFDSKTLDRTPAQTLTPVAQKALPGGELKNAAPEETLAQWLWGSNALIESRRTKSSILVTFSGSEISFVTPKGLNGRLDTWPTAHDPAAPIIGQIQNDGGLVLWKAQDQSLLKIELPHRWRGARALAIDMSNGIAFIGLGDNSTLWPLSDRKNQTIEADKAREHGHVIINGVRFDKRDFAEQDERGRIIVFDLRTQKVLSKILLSPKRLPVTELIWDPLRLELIARTENGQIFYNSFDPEEVRPKSALPRPEPLRPLGLLGN
jgi:hypothetical protein